MLSMHSKYCNSSAHGSGRDVGYDEIDDNGGEVMIMYCCCCRLLMAVR